MISEENLLAYRLGTRVEDLKTSMPAWVLNLVNYSYALFSSLFLFVWISITLACFLFADNTERDPKMKEAFARKRALKEAELKKKVVGEAYTEKKLLG